MSLWRKTARALGSLIYLLVFSVLILPPMLILGLVSYTGIVIGEILFWGRMVRRGRYLSPSKCRNLLQDVPGTLLIECPCLGWGVTRAWWTEEDVLKQAPAAPPAREAWLDQTIWNHPFTQWAHQRYTDEAQGKARLVRVWKAERLKRRWARRYPQLPSVEVHSCTLLPNDDRTEP